MDLSGCKQILVLGVHLNSLACKCLALVIIALILRAALISDFSSFSEISRTTLVVLDSRQLTSNRIFHSGNSKFLEVPQIIWGFNNQKIAFARACLTARLLNRTLLMPSLSGSLFYKEVSLLKPISFDKVFDFEKFNSRCKGFVQLSRYSEVSNLSDVVLLQKGSGRRWTLDRDMDQLKEFSTHPYDKYEIVRIVGKNPFLWNDHWPVKEYEKIFKCLALVDEISKEADKVILRIREIGLEESQRLGGSTNVSIPVPYLAVHMRLEKDWMIHCKKSEQRLRINEICSSKKEIIERVGNIRGLKTPIVVYIAVADNLLEDNSVLTGWEKGLLPYEKKKLGVVEIYKKHPYLIQSAIDYEVCLRSDVFVGNSFSTFSSLIVLDRNQKMIDMGSESLCGVDVRWPSYAYNLAGESGGARPWASNMSDTSLLAISYGTNQISCQ